MELKSFDQLEKKINTLVEKYINLKSESRRLEKELNDLKDEIRILKNVKEKTIGKIKGMITEVENLNLFS